MRRTRKGPVLPPRTGASRRWASRLRSPSLETKVAAALAGLILLATAAVVQTDRRISDAILQLPADTERKGLHLSIHEARIHAGLNRPDLVLLISLDAFRADRFDWNGYDRATTPHLSRLAEEGVVFTTVGAQSSHPLVSHKSMLAGRYPGSFLEEEAGADLITQAAIGEPREFLLRTLLAVESLLPEAFAEAGFETSAFTTGGWTGEDAGLAASFDHFDGTGRSLEELVPRLEFRLRSRRSPAFVFVQSDEIGAPRASTRSEDEAFCEDCSTHVDLTGGVGGAAALGPLTELDLTAVSDHYDADVADADAALGRLFERLRSLGIWDEALVCVTSAHGLALGEGGVFGHGALSPGELLVPMVLKLPGSWEVPPEVVGEAAELVDLMPTLLALCGVSRPNGVDGRSRVPTIFRGVRARRELVAQTTLDGGGARDSNLAIRSILRPGEWQVVYDGRTGSVELLSLESDSGGSGPLQADPAHLDLPGYVEELLERPRTAPPDGLYGISGPAVDAKRLEALRTLGAP